MANNFLTNNSHYWGYDSTDSRLGQFESGLIRGQLSSKKLKNGKEYDESMNNYQLDKKILSVKKKGVNFVELKKTSNNGSKRNVRNVSIKDDNPCKVKTSALLYEITDRVNRLAQPRIRSNIPDKSETGLMVKKKILEPTQRILELSKPKNIYEPPSKLHFCVTPAALNAIPTDRILELSRPKKNLKKGPGKKRKLIYAPCNPRILYLARAKGSKRNIDDRPSKSSSRRPRKPLRTESQKKTNKLEPGWRRRGEPSSYIKNCSKKGSTRRERGTRMRKCSMKHLPRSSYSDRTVVTIAENYDSKACRNKLNKIRDAYVNSSMKCSRF